MSNVSSSVSVPPAAAAPVAATAGPAAPPGPVAGAGATSVPAATGSSHAVVSVVSKAGGVARAKPVDMAEIRKNALSHAEQVAKEAARQETLRREQEKTERLYRPAETTTAAAYEAKDRAIGEVAKVDGVLWTVKETSDGTKQWERADRLDPKPVLTVCGSVQGQGQCGGKL